MATPRLVAGSGAPAPSAAAPQLVVLSGPHQGDVVVLDDTLPLVIGRRAGLSFPDPELDPVHAQVFPAGGRWFLQDFGSPAGTWLGEERVDGARPLEPGRPFRVGQTRLALLVGGAAPDPLAAARAPAAALDPDEEALLGAKTDALAVPARPGERTPARAPRRLGEDTDVFVLETPPAVQLDLAAPAAAADAAADAAGQAVGGAAAAARPPLAAHDRLGDYDIIGELGRGALGSVYKGYDRKRRRVVAVKVLDPEQAQDAATVARFLRGAQAGARLQHPAIVQVLAAGHADGRIYVTMEYVEGVDLGAACEAAGGRLAPRLAVSLLARIVDALVYAHGREVIHRAVSPRNILVGPGGTAKLSDLALAKKTEKRGLAITHAGQVLTRSPFAAPEVLFDVERVDHRADVFGVGATLYRAVTGHLPYEGTPLEALQRHQEGRHEDPRRWVKTLSPALVAVIDRCLRPDPGARYQAMRDLREAFADLPEASEGS